MPTTITQSHGMKTTSHNIDFQGFTGLIFWLLLVGLLIYVIGFATTGWVVVGDVHTGLWGSCECSRSPPNEAWFKATQAMICIGLICLVFAVIVTGIYMFLHKLNKNYVLIVAVALPLVGVVFMLIGIIVFGAMAGPGLNYSFAFVIMGAMATLASGILGIIQMRKSGVM